MARRFHRFVVVAAISMPASAQTTIHVARAGSDTNPGTADLPFESLERARAAVRASGRGTREVVVHGGSYELRSTFELAAADSGTRDEPVLWRAAEGEVVRLAGGRSVRAGALAPVTDPAILERLDPGAREHVLSTDLSILGVSAPEPFPVAFHGAPPGPELYWNEQRMTLARWPNEGWASVAKILESGSCPREGDTTGRPGAFEFSGERPARWSVADGVWLQGYWCFDWYDEVIRIAAIDPVARRISLAAPHLYSLRQGNPAPRRYRALNVLEELDRPGEYWVDRARNLLYLWPPEEVADGELALGSLETPLVALHDTSHVTLRGFVLENGLGDGVVVEGGTGCHIEACEIRNVRLLGVRVSGGLEHRVEACDIHDTGTGGLVLEGGDRKTLTPAGHEAINNHVWRFSVHQLTAAYGLRMGGVGNRAAHNRIHHAPHEAVTIGGNDHVFELNEVYDVCTETDDCAALHKGRNPSCRGNQIRFNSWHDIGAGLGHGNAAVYFDDGDGGDFVFGNVFYRCGEPGFGSFGAVFSHGGHGNHAENNVFVECKRALGSAPWDDARWSACLQGAEETFFPQKLLEEVDITKPPYTTRYPELVGFLDPATGAPRVNHARRNVLVKCGETTSGNWQFDPAENLVCEDDPGFVDMTRGDFRLRPDAEVFRRLPGFEAIPFERIGLQRSPLRPNVDGEGGAR